MRKSRLVATTLGIAMLASPVLAAHATSAPTVDVTTDDGHVYQPGTRPVVEGTASDADGDLNHVRVTFRTAYFGLWAEIDADLQCDSARTHCTWSAEVPYLEVGGVKAHVPGTYTVFADAFDDLGQRGSSRAISIVQPTP